MADVQKTILDLKPHHIRKICEYLGLRDIINIAEAIGITEQRVKSLKSAIGNDQSHPNIKFLRFAESVQQAFEESGKYLCIDGSTSSFDINEVKKLLHHFDDRVLSLTVDYPNDRTMVVAIDDMVQKHFRYSALYPLELCNVNEHVFATITGPFPDMEHVNLSGYVGSNLSKFNEWFPQLSILELYEVSFAEPESIECHFLRLSELHVRNDTETSDCSTMVTGSNLKIALQLNPQLKTLVLYDDDGGRDDCGICLDKQFLYFIQRKLPDLCSLFLTISNLNEGAECRPGQIVFNNLDHLDICITKWSYLSKIPIKSEKLNRLCLEQSEVWSQMDPANFEAMANFVKLNKSIGILHIRNWFTDYDLCNEKLFSLVNTLTQLEEILVYYDWQSTTAADSIIHCLMQCKNIKKLKAVIPYRPIAKKDQEHFVKSFQSYADINGFDASLWNIEFERMIVSIEKKN